MAETRTARARTGWVPGLVSGVVSLLLTLSACGGDPPPSESVPGLATRLDRVDAAIEAGDLDQARSALDGLAAVAGQARSDGRITDDQADEILDAIAAMLRGLDSMQSTSVPAEEPVPDDGAPTGGDEGDAVPSDDGKDEGKDEKDKDKGDKGDKGNDKD